MRVARVEYLSSSPALFFVNPAVKGFLLSEVSDLSSRVPRVATPTREDDETFGAQIWVLRDHEGNREGEMRKRGRARSPWYNMTCEGESRERGNEIKGVTNRDICFCRRRRR